MKMSHMSRIWSEIRNDYIDESDLSQGCIEMSIDAWQSSESDGESIAKIIAIQTKHERIIRVVYIDNAARMDKYAQEVIQDGIKQLEKYDIPLK